MKVTNLRAGGMGVPEIFKVTSHDRCFVMFCAEEHAYLHHDKADIHEWPCFDDMMHDAVDAVARGGGEPSVKRIVDEYARRHI